MRRAWSHPKTVAVAKPLQDLFGEQITLLELWITLGFGLALSAALLSATHRDWMLLPTWRQALLIILAFDICGGVVGNFAYSTNEYYRKDPAARLRFIALHVHPLILALLLGHSYWLATAVNVYTVSAALVTNAMIHHPAQRIIGASLMAAGITTLLLTAHGAPSVLIWLLALYMFKVIYGFAVDHYAGLSA
jgi:hypothetical protein